MKQFIAQLSRREKQLLMYGGLLVLVVLLWLLVYRPVTEYLSQQAALKTQLQQQLSSMQQAVTGLTGQVSQDTRELPAGQTFSAWIDGQLKQLGMQQAVKRSEPIDDKTVTLWLEFVPFDPWADWLQRINQQYGVVVEQVDVSITDRSLGLVTLRMRITKS